MLFAYISQNELDALQSTSKLWPLDVAYYFLCLKIFCCFCRHVMVNTLLCVCVIIYYTTVCLILVALIYTVYVDVLPASRQESWTTTPAVVVVLSIGCSTYMNVRHRRPSVLRRRGTNIEQFASWSHVILILQIFKTKLKSHLFLASFA